jgi:hypothetical protein
MTRNTPAFKDLTGAAGRTFTAIEEGQRGDAVASLEPVHARPDFGDLAAELMTHHIAYRTQRIARSDSAGLGETVFKRVQIGAADAAGAHPQHHLTSARLRFGNIFDGQPVFSFAYDCFHLNRAPL